MPEDTAGSGFARLLRELKDRSGLSYGTLAKRLHMSTSTLHRYCTGDVVPTEYAPVDRFARLCKASPEELLELHRNWVLADTNRPRRGAVEAEGPARAAAAPATPPSPSPQESGPGATQEPAPADTPPAAAAPERRRRPRAAALAGIAAVVVAGAIGAVALTAQLTSGDADDRPAAAASPAPGAGKRADGRTASPAPSAPSPSASTPSGAGTGTSATPAPSGSGPASGSGSAPGTPSGDGAVSGTPVEVTAQPYTWESPCGQHYLIEKPPSEVGPPPLERDAPAWVAATRAVSAGEQYVTLTLQGAGKETVVLDGLTVRTVGKHAPLPWNDYAMGYPGVGCGAGVPTRSFTVALDAARPAVVPAPGQPDFPFKVSESEPEVFYVKADASAYDVSWYLELSWSSGSRHGTLTIDHNGKPFRTSGPGGRPGYEFPLGGDGWVKAGTTS
ncbi:helix-turn-helix domain-containing protein [Streptomyces sp. MJM1172]|uniref:helix-turn-helix domain-containing protein n=1 Tax=Streptomyces sp. MJM1172 TaxID=1703926 RepID=UPI00093BC658|nr:helix-turn-helix transcriptional regulator [Streptomyces sp. MJM1172]OKI54430.1 DNA-binding protein [Streptomyces sp. MJM1172]